MCKNKEINKLSSESGTYLLFFVAGILPLLMFLLALSVDITNYMRADQRLQEAADDAAILAWRYLPYQKQAIDAVTRFLAQRGLSDSILEVRMAPTRSYLEDFNDEFEVILAQNLPLTFMSYLAQEAALPIKSIARTRTTPIDLYIALDRSTYMAPNLLSNTWDNSNISDYFIKDAPFTNFIDPETGNSVAVAPAAFMTQLCFNSYFSEIKRTAILLYEFFSAAGRNGVGIGVFPGVGIENLTSIRGVLRATQNVDANGGEAHPLQISAIRNQQDYYYYSGIRLGASSWCAAAAAQDRNVKSNPSYGTGLNARIEKLWRRSSPDQLDESHIIKAQGDDVVFNPEYQDSLTVRESLWSAIAKNSIPNSRGVFDSVITNLANTPDSEVLFGGAGRGGLVGTATRTGIILAGDVPYFNGVRFNDQFDLVAEQISQSFAVLRQLLVDNSNLRFKLIYIVINDPSRPSTPALLNLEDRTARLADFFEMQQDQISFNGRLGLQVVYSDDLQKLKEKILATLVLDNSNKVVSY